jgi:hypothetical protein
MPRFRSRLKPAYFRPYLRGVRPIHWGVRFKYARIDQPEDRMTIRPEVPQTFGKSLRAAADRACVMRRLSPGNVA